MMFQLDVTHGVLLAGLGFQCCACGSHGDLRLPLPDTVRESVGRDLRIQSSARLYRHGYRQKSLFDVERR